MKVLLTGASGFLGRGLAAKLQFNGNIHLTALVRRNIDLSPVNTLQSNSLDSNADLSFALDGQNVVIHTAARTHVMKNEVFDSLAEFRLANTSATLNIAKQAAKLGVKRFIFISSIKVNGDVTKGTNFFTEKSYYIPRDPYGLSKYEAEQGLLELSDESGMEVIIIRPPLIYGPGVKGNFSSIINLIKKNYPLPLARIIQNKRSLIALDNLVDFILLCADYNKTPQAANQTFVISDGEDISTAQLFKKVAKAYGKKSCLFPFPPSLLRLGARVLGKQGMADRLLGSLQVDSSKARELLGWKPVITMDEQLRKMAQADGFTGKTD